MKSRMILGLAAAGLACAMLAGCGPKVSQSNYEKIANGMSMAEVEGILGKGTEEAGLAGAIGNLGGSAMVMSWTDGEKTITVTFVNGKVTLKAQKGL